LPDALFSPTPHRADGLTDQDFRPLSKKVKLSISRSSILTAIVVATILAAVPGQIQRFLNTGEPYLFSHLFFGDMLARLSGPGRLRFIVQPAIALFLGIRDGAKDAQAGSPPFLAALLSKRTHKRTLLLSALASIRDLVAMAILVDVISQFLLFRNIHPAAALLLGPTLIAVPYATSRGLANRLARKGSERTPVAHPR
jgi:hypothetical protein